MCGFVDCVDVGVDTPPSAHCPIEFSFLKSYSIPGVVIVELRDYRSPPLDAQRVSDAAYRNVESQLRRATTWMRGVLSTGEKRASKGSLTREAMNRGDRELLPRGRGAKTSLGPCSSNLTRANRRGSRNRLRASLRNGLQKSSEHAVATSVPVVLGAQATRNSTQVSPCALRPRNGAELVGSRSVRDGYGTEQRGSSP